jgi:gliding motility-associated-like protein
MDNGGASGDYALEINSIYQTICPTIAGQSISLTFNSFDMEDGFDYIKIKNGPAQNSTAFTTAPADAAGWITGTPTVPFTYTATNSSGCLTVLMFSDIIIPGPGFNATISEINNGATLSAGNSDCATSTYICSNTSFNDVSNGPGISPDEGCTGSCLTGEAYSNWYTFSVLTGGTLTLTINPNTNTDDYDFAVFGPNTACGSTPIRCSFASASGSGNTGLNAVSLDLSEDAGGNGYVKQLTVAAGETYQLYVNSWTAGGAGFAMNFGGTATLGAIPPTINSETVCGTVSSTLTATPTKTGGTYLWSPGGETTQSISVSPSSTTVYTCIYTIDGCTSGAGSGTVTVNTPPTITGVLSVCESMTTQLSGTGIAAASSPWLSATTASASVSATGLVTGIAGGSSLITYTDNNGCTNTATVVVNSLPIGTFSYTSSPYCSSGVDPSPTYGVGGIAGTFSSTAGLNINSSNGTVDLSASTAGTYTVTNTIAAASGCPAVTPSSSITITALPVGTFSYPATPYCIDALDPSPVYSVGGIAGTFSSTAGLTINSASGLVTLSTSTPGTYTVTNTIAAAAGCPSVAPTSSITITALPIGTFSYMTNPYCSSGSDPSPTYSGGGIAGSFSSTAGLIINSASGLVDVSASTGGTYSVTNTIAAAGGCASIAPTSSIVITTSPDASFSYVGVTFCQSGSNPLVTLGASSVAGVFSSTPGLVFVSTATGEVDILASTIGGPYTVTNTIAAASGCPIVTATAPITISLGPDATFSYALSSYCQNGTDPSPVLGVGASSGVYSSTAGLVFVNSATGQIDLSASSIGGPYVITNTIAASGGCASVLSTYSVSITGSPVATFSYTGTPYCSDGIDPSPLYSGGGIAGTFSSSAGLVLNASSGLVGLVGSTSGTYTVTNTIAATSGCAAVIATSPLTVTVLPVATFSYTGSPYCSNGSDPLPTFSGGGVAGNFTSTAGLTILSASTGLIDLSASTAGGPYTVTNTIVAAGGCPLVFATSPITIAAQSVGTFNYGASTYCSSAVDPSPVFTGGGVAGVFSSTAGLSINTASGIIDLSASTAGNYTVTNTIAAVGACPQGISTFPLVITAAPIGTFSYLATPYCSNGVDPSPTYSGGGAAGLFSSTAGLIINASSGIVDLSASTAGTYTVTNTIAAASGCPAVTPTSSITITNLPVGTFSYVGTPFCSNGVDPSPVFSVGAVAGVFGSTVGLSINSATGLVDLSASTAGTYTVTNTIAAASGCPAVTPTSIITIAALPVGTFSYTASPYCSDGVDPSPTFSGGGVAGVFGSTAGLSINVASGLIDLSASTAGTYTVTNTIAAASGCPASAPTSSITITALPIGTFSYVASPYCSTGVDPLPTYSGGGAAGTFSGTAGLVINAATGLVDLGASTAGTFTVTNTISASGGCPLVAPISTITITTALTGLFSYISTPYCSDAVNPLPTFSGGGVAGVFSSTAGLVINGATGLVDLSACLPGTYTVTNTIAAFTGCPAITPTSSITVTSLPTGVFSYVDAPYCTDGINPIPVVGAGSTAGTYSSTAGLTINPANGEVDLGLSIPATYVVTNSIPAAGGCPIVLTTSNIVINGIPAAPSVSADATYCSFTSPSDIVAIAGGGGTIIWYSDVTLLDSIGAGLTFTPITTVGTNNYYVTETVSGCESPASLSIQVVQFCDIEIPTAFTPDGDLVNDSWELKFIDEVFAQNQVKIYNRWGNLIFESSKGQYETKPFDGTFNGDQLPISSYYYIIEYNDGATENATGTVTIIRK